MYSYEIVCDKLKTDSSIQSEISDLKSALKG